MKRKTKAQREETLKAALLQRLHDIYSGARGNGWEQDSWPTPEEMARLVCACKDIFGNDESKWMFSVATLKEFDTPETAADFLFRNGVRA